MNKAINKSALLSGLLSTCIFVAQPMSFGANPKNIPYVVGAFCGSHGEPSVRVINQGGHHALQVNADNQSSGGQSFAGWEVFSSHPGVIPGFIFPNPTTRATPGTYAFTVSGLPKTGNTLLAVSIDSLGNSNSSSISVSNGPVSIVAPPVPDSGSPLCAVYFWIYTDQSTPLRSYTLSNFTVNNDALGIDATHVDDDTKTGGPNVRYTWCLEF
ncbi:hypothetical protein BH10CYA1_BH10CYA1_27630 [soil metagenome]